jgi:hypothetical protein
MKRIVVLMCLLVCFGQGFISAAQISWSVEDFDDAAKIDNKGTVLAAYNLGSGTSVVVNGVTFAAENDGPLNDTYFKYSSNGSYGYSYYNEWLYNGYSITGLADSDADALLDTFVQDSTYFDPNSDQMTIKNLIVGKTYKVQILLSDCRGLEADMVFDGTFVVRYTGGLDYAKLVTGTFTADATQQVFTAGYIGWGSNTYSNINALLVAEIFPAKTPYPLDNTATLYPVSGLTLTWQAGFSSGCTGYFLYADPNKAKVDSSVSVATSTAEYAVSIPYSANGQYMPGPPLATDSTYYWRVDERKTSDSDYINGFVWKFSTEKLLAQITTQPHDQRKLPGETAAFNVAATSSTSVQYQWRRIKAGVDTALTGKTSTMLTITGIGTGDIAQYYCVLTNTAGSVSTNAVWLTVNKLIGQWKFDNNANDISGFGNNAIVVNAPYVTDSNGTAISFSGVYDDSNETQYVQIPSQSIGEVMGSRSQISIAFWAKGGDLQPRANVIFRAANAAGNPVMQIDLPWSDSNVYWRAGSATYLYDYEETSGSLFGNENLYKNNWNHWVFTKNTDDGNMSMYINGQFWGTRTAVSLEIGQPASIALGSGIFLATDTSDPRYGTFITGYPYQGMVKDFRIYNYDLTDDGVAQLYYDATGNPVCVDRPSLDISGPGGSPDCVVSFFDFAAFAEEWLTCGLIPSTECN